MRLVAQWRRIESELPADWSEARLAVEVRHDERHARAAALLGPANPGRKDRALLFTASRSGAGTGPEAVRRLLERLDGERIAGTLTLLSATEQPVVELAVGPSLAAAWETALATLPGDWSDLLCELEVGSSDYVQRTALMLSPLNPTRDPAKVAFRFRVAHRFGYGASPQMVRRCLERVDEEGIRGRVAILRALSDTHNVATQGPVWYVAGKPV
jgi:hypothetical protein